MLHRCVVVLLLFSIVHKGENGVSIVVHRCLMFSHNVCVINIEKFPCGLAINVYCCCMNLVDYLIECYAMM